MSHWLDVVAGLTLAISASVAPALADPLEGTWGGADAEGRSAQVAIAGNSFIGVYWIDDDRDAANPRFSERGARLGFEVVGRKATLVRAGAGARVTACEPKGVAVSINLKRDQGRAPLPL